MNIKSIIIIFLSVISITVQVICVKFDNNKFEKKIIALAKVLKYMIKRPKQMNLDAMFGVTFTQANLQAAVQHKNLMLLDSYETEILLNTLKLTKDTQSVLQVNNNFLDGNIIKMNKKINRPEIWIKPIIWKKMNLSNKLSPDPNLTLKDTINLMFSGHPQEEESDECFFNLMHQCQFPSKCQDFITHNNSTTGYPLTHRLLIMQIMTALQCKTNISKYYSYFSYKFCSLILQDLINLEAMEFPYVSKDLASEQVLLCGMEGYLDFLDNHYEQLILNWQHPSGCYSGMGLHSQWSFGKVRIRREGTFTDYGCVNHATGLGAAALALIIRKDIETFHN